MMNLKLISIAMVMYFSWFNGMNNQMNIKPKSHNYILLKNYQVSGETFYKNQCGFCHNAEELIAPDMNKIKAKYLEKFNTKDAFIKAVMAFVKNPDKKNAIYRDGIDNFSDMPKMPFKDEQIKAVAEYIYTTKTL